jgi:uncharacterized protein (TIGR00369 family)
MTKAHVNLTPLAHAASNRCFGCGPANATGLQLEFFLAPDGAVVSLPTVGDAFEGHPGFLHGGVIVTLLDEAMSKAVRATGRVAVTRNIEVDFLRPVLSGAPLRLEGRVVRSDGRKHWAESEIVDAEGKLLAQAKGLFLEITQDQKKGG